MSNLYMKVSAMQPGTVFQVNGGAPWLRGEGGVVDLAINFYLGKFYAREERGIPEIWVHYTHDVTEIYTPEED